MKASYNEQPQALELMPDGYHKFRFEIEIITNSGQTQYTCHEVDVYGSITSEKIIELVINEKWGNGVEQKFINDYNEYVLGIGNISSKTSYQTFLSERKKLKEYVKNNIN